MAAPPQQTGPYGPRYLAGNQISVVLTNPAKAVNLPIITAPTGNQVIELNWLRLNVSGGSYNDPAGLVGADLLIQVNTVLETLKVAVVTLPAAAPVPSLGILYDSGTIHFPERYPAPVDPGNAGGEIDLYISDIVASGIAAIVGTIVVSAGYSITPVIV